MLPDLKAPGRAHPAHLSLLSRTEIAATGGGFAAQRTGSAELGLLQQPLHLWVAGQGSTERVLQMCVYAHTYKNVPNIHTLLGTETQLSPSVQQAHSCAELEGSPQPHYEAQIRVAQFAALSSMDLGFLHLRFPCSLCLWRRKKKLRASLCSWCGILSF